SVHHLDDAGWRALRAHGLRTVVDLRSDFERTAAPYAAAGDLAVVETGWEDGLLDDPEFRSWAEDGSLATAWYYRRFLERWPERTAGVVAAVADAAPGGVLVHCVRGRERTGLLVLLLLAVAGVDHGAIVAGFAETDRRLLGVRPADGPDGTEAERALWAGAGTSAAATVAALLDELDVAAYLLAGGCTPDQLDRVRERLVGPASAPDEAGR
ncbi:MAG TPA: tyrosine-protein phosphatase, partial [Aquihabitans sp.]|nr:tyrosine-protein phosphatase [Aquihabitans sp.]